MDSGEAPFGGSPGQGPGERTQSPDTAADLGGRDLRKGPAADGGDGLKRLGNVSSWACKLNAQSRSVPVRRDVPFFYPEGRTYSPPASGRWYGLRPPCALRGGLRFLRKAPADASRHRRRNRRLHSHVLACCLRKPATGSFSQFTEDEGRGTGNEGRR